MRLPAIATLCLLSCGSENRPPPAPYADLKQGAAEYLKWAVRQAMPDIPLELVGLALLRAGDPEAGSMAARIRDQAQPILFTPALQAMFLQELNATVHRDRIALCARMLADSQLANGQWSYTVEGCSEPPRAQVAACHTPPYQAGRNCVAQFAALGIDACSRAGFRFSRQIPERARDWWIRDQNTDGGWGCCGSRYSTGAITAGALTALVIYSRLLGEDPAALSAFRRGIEWLRANFTLGENPGAGARWLLYWYMALAEFVRRWPDESWLPAGWRQQGAEWLSKNRDPSGNCWAGEHLKVTNTAYALIFLSM